MRVLKFGGSSMATALNIEKVVSIIQASLETNDKIILVVSALGGITNNLLEAANLALEKNENYLNTIEQIANRHIEIVKAIIPFQKQNALLANIKELCNELEDICKGVFLLRELTAHTKDSICSYGEILSSTIFSAVLKHKNIENTWCNSLKLIKTDSEFGRASADLASTTEKLIELLKTDNNKCLLFPGFIGSDKNDKTTTLGRGGSDYTAAIIGAVLKAEAIEIWTDVSGMMTADPGMVKNVKIIPEISYEEALELSHFGAKVIYPKTIAPVIENRIPLRIKNTFAPRDKGTIIQYESRSNGNPIRGISSMRHVAIITLEGSGMIGSPGFSKRLFGVLAVEKINVILISQSSSEYSICVVVEEIFAEKAQSAINANFAGEIHAGRIKPVRVEKELAIVALVGDNMKSRVGMSGKMFSALGRNGINVRAIAQGSTERNISTVISHSDVKKGINVLHEEFFESSYKQINLYICGTGNVGEKLLDQLHAQSDWLKERMHLQLRVASIANSRKKLFSDAGIDLDAWTTKLENGDSLELSDFIEKVTSENRRNSIFVDMTANADVAATYPLLLEKSISVVACNKIACSSASDYYQKLKSLANRFNCSFLFETNVGAGLPVIGTLNDLLRSGDEITSIEAVLSGTLNFVFNNYTEPHTFSQVVKMAASQGFTEPDPRLDLSGIDVMRKILILVRESGFNMEMDDIANNSFMPPQCMEGDIDNFYDQLKNNEDHFKSILNKARKKKMKLKYVAEFKNDKITTGLKEIPPEHDFYHLYGKDNAVIFYTRRYSEQPLVIKGAGAGAEVTASGVFADILRAAK